MIRPKFVLAFAAAALLVFVAGPVRGAVLYYDDFDGSSGTDLNGTAPDTRPGGETWTATSLWKADGSKSANGSASAWLPFAPTGGRLYTLSLDANPYVSGSSDWFAIGLSPSNNTGGNFHDDVSVAWMLNREDDTSTSVVQTFRGPGTGGGGDYNIEPDKVGPVKLEVALDTRSPLWTAEWFVDGTSIRGPEALGATNPVISYAGFGAYNSATGTVDNFTLSETVFPEHGIQIGLGAGFGTQVDNSQNRLNVEGEFVHLEAGTYSVLDFEFKSSAAGGNVTPFLAKPTGNPNEYETLWVGPAFSPAGADVQTDTYAPGDEFFTLAEAADVYVGFAQDDPRVMFDDPYWPSLTDHDSSFTTPTGPGQIITGFSNPDLPRNYAFRVNVAAGEIPEPASVALAALALAGLGGYVRRRRRN